MARRLNTIILEQNFDEGVVLTAPWLSDVHNGYARIERDFYDKIDEDNVRLIRLSY